MKEPSDVNDPLKYGLPKKDDEIPQMGDDIFQCPAEMPIFISPRTPRLDNMTTPRWELPLAGCWGEQQLESMRLVLAEQRQELNRVVESFESRLLVLCQTAGQVMQPCTATMESTVEAKSAEPQGHATKSSSPAPSEGKFGVYIDGRSEWPELEPTSSYVLDGGEPQVSHIKWSSHDDEDSIVAEDSIFRRKSGRSLASFASRSSQVTSGTKAGRFVQSAAFETCSCAIISFDAIVIGVAADYSVRNRGQNEPKVFQDIGLLCLIWYCVEILLRLGAAPRTFFISGWNVFDLLCISFDLFARVFSTASEFDNVAIARAFRWFRAFRVFRSLRFLRELRMMAKCIVACSQTVVWVFLFMFMNVYVFAVYLVGQVAVEFREEALTDSTSTDILQQRFGTLSDACLSLFMAISGGISWVEFTDALISIHWTNGLVVFVFIFFTTFALLNIVTGVFVESAVAAGRQDEHEVFQKILDGEKSSIKRIRQLFKHINEDDDDYISRDELESKLVEPEVRLLLKSMGMGAQQARGLFDMLDLDGSGHVTLDEFISCSMRVQDASHLDILTILHENKSMRRKMRSFHCETKKGFEAMSHHICRLEQRICKRLVCD